MSYQDDDHGRVVTSGAWFGALIVSGLLAIADLHMPFVLGWLLNSSVILGVSYFMARWKRAWYAWACFYGLVAVCLLNGLLKAATPWLDGSWSAGTQTLAWLLVGCWYWLVRAPRKQLPKAPDVSHVVHHHVIHGPGPTLPPGIDVTQLPGVVHQVGTDEPIELPGRLPRAIEQAAVRPEAFIGRPGELSARLRAMWRRKM